MRSMWNDRLPSIPAGLPFIGDGFLWDFFLGPTGRQLSFKVVHPPS